MAKGESWKKEVGTWRDERNLEPNTSNADREDFYQKFAAKRAGLKEEIWDNSSELDLAGKYKESGLKTYEDIKAAPELKREIKRGDTLYKIIEEYFKGAGVTDEEALKKEVASALPFLMSQGEVGNYPHFNVDHLEAGGKFEIRDGLLFLWDANGKLYVNGIKVKPSSVLLPPIPAIPVVGEAGGLQVDGGNVEEGNATDVTEKVEASPEQEDSLLTVFIDGAIIPVTSTDLSDGTRQALENLTDNEKAKLEQQLSAAPVQTPLAEAPVLSENITLSSVEPVTEDQFSEILDVVLAKVLSAEDTGDVVVAETTEEEDTTADEPVEESDNNDGSTEQAQTAPKQPISINFMRTDFPVNPDDFLESEHNTGKSLRRLSNENRRVLKSILEEHLDSYKDLRTDDENVDQAFFVVGESRRKAGGEIGFRKNNSPLYPSERVDLSKILIGKEQFVEILNRVWYETHKDEASEKSKEMGVENAPKAEKTTLDNGKEYDKNLVRNTILPLFRQRLENNGLPLPREFGLFNSFSDGNLEDVDAHLHRVYGAFQILGNPKHEFGLSEQEKKLLAKKRVFLGEKGEVTEAGRRDENGNFIPEEKVIRIDYDAPPREIARSIKEALEKLKEEDGPAE